jgi:hypothetical protein
MSEVIYHSTDFSPVIIPKFKGLVEPKIRYTHEIDRLSTKSIKMSVTVFLAVKDVKGGNMFEIVNATSLFTVKIETELTIEDLYKVFNKSFTQFREEYRGFEVSQKVQQMNIKVDKLEDMKPHLSNIVAWYYSP